MKNKTKKSFYILCDFEYKFHFSGSRQLKKEPLLFYEDGTLEMESIGKFKDHTRIRYRKDLYNEIKQCMTFLNNPAMDLRHYFSSINSDLTLDEVLFTRMPDKKHFSRKELLKLFYERQIEKIIYNLEKVFYKMLNRRMIMKTKPYQQSMYDQKNIIS
jgi:hypothetical protein